MPAVNAFHFLLPQFGNLVSDLLQSRSQFAPSAKQLLSFIQEMIEFPLKLLKMLDLSLEGVFSLERIIHLLLVLP